MISAIAPISCHMPQYRVSTMMHNISKISALALPIITIASIPIVKAGIITATACFIACESFLATLSPPAAIAYAPTCFAGCKIALTAPTP